ncbi:MAG: GNAT family N-acetyltransferase, partial [Gorillibacterium sp.]|nr:GNAT family N-acetyltransferase [Gorillibacterium sp.]
MSNFVHPLFIVPLSEDFAREVCGWRYPPPYELYSWPDWDQMVLDGYEFADSTIRAEQYRGVVDETGERIGFLQFFPLEGVTRLGMGLRPDLCGKGLGAVMARKAAEEARLIRPGCRVDLEVLIWNDRARKAYLKAGFIIDDDYERSTPT